MPASPFRAIVYAAVSKEEQADPDLPSLGTQIENARAFCEANGIPVVGEVRIEGHSRNYTRLDRLVHQCPDYGRMMDAIEEGEANLIVCNDYDRLWRTDALRAQVAATCRENEARIYAVNQPTPLAAGDAASAFWLELVWGGISQQENATRISRFQTGKRGRTLRGLPASSRSPYGYQRDPSRPVRAFIPEPETARWVRWIFERRAEGWGYARIALALNEQHVPPPSSAQAWHKTTVAYILRNPFYRGEVRYRQWGHRKPNGGQAAQGGKPLQQTVAEGQHKPLIDPELWEAAQQMRERTGRDGHHQRNPENRDRYIYQGLVQCGVCGHAMTYTMHRTHYRLKSGEKRVRGQTYHIVCHARYTSYEARQTCTRSNHHSMRQIHVELLAQIQAHLTRQTALDAAALEAQARQRHEETRAALQSELRSIDSGLERWYDALESGRFPLAVIEKRTAELRERQRQRQAELEELDRAQADHEASTQRQRQLAELLPRLPSFSPADLRRVALALIRTIRIYPGDAPLEIEWR